uniref:Uncharacterized protein n=1 Tax=Arcella intermedia TaxID=1963864 RepID=A0A6B2LIZ8_9EUKA
MDPEVGPDGQYPPIKQENETDPLSFQDAYAYQQYYQQQYQDWQYQQQQQEQYQVQAQAETKKRDTELFDPEDQWDAKEVLAKEKIPEKSLAQILQTEEQTDIAFKKPKQSSANAKRGRRKK